MLLFSYLRVVRTAAAALQERRKALYSIGSTIAIMELGIRSERMTSYDKHLVGRASELMEQGWRTRNPYVLNEARHRLAALARLNTRKPEIFEQARAAERKLFRDMRREGLVRDTMSFAPYVHENTCPWVELHR